MRMPFTDLKDWWLSNGTIATALGHPAPKPVFIPVSQQPYTTFPFVRYSTQDYAQSDSYWNRRQDIILGMYMQDMGKSTEVLYEMMDMAKEDESARHLNRWLIMNGGSMYNFKSVAYSGGGEITPPEEQGGHHIRTATFVVRYTFLGKN